MKNFPCFAASNKFESLDTDQMNHNTSVVRRSNLEELSSRMRCGQRNRIDA